LLIDHPQRKWEKRGVFAFPTHSISTIEKSWGKTLLLKKIEIANQPFVITFFRNKVTTNSFYGEESSK